MDDTVINEYNELLNNISNELDITPIKYEQAVERYKAVGIWLEDGVYPADTHNSPYIYTQGSFRLGTVVRPIREGKESDYDIDLVCELQIDKDTTTPRDLKMMIGDRLKAHGTYKRLLDDEGRRCWTLQYSEADGIGFHLDILPSLPEDRNYKSALTMIGVPSETAEKAITISHKNEAQSYAWSSSNPNGYANWFNNRIGPIFEKVKSRARRRIFENNIQIFASVDDVPDQLIKTPLQKAIQILKRHRDMRFVGHRWEKEKPISMILTTLSALLYNQEADVFSTLQNVISLLNAHSSLLNPRYRLEEHVASLNIMNRLSDGTWYIPNPVNPNENFADRWHENDNRRAKAFFQWVDWAHNDLVEILTQVDSIKEIVQRLDECLGKNIEKRAASGHFVLGGPVIIHSKGDRAPHIEIKNPSKPWSSIGI